MILASVNNLTYYGKTLPAHRKNADQASSLNLSTEKKKIFGKEFLNLLKVSMGPSLPGCVVQVCSVSLTYKLLLLLFCASEGERRMLLFFQSQDLNKLSGVWPSTLAFLLLGQSSFSTLVLGHVTLVNNLWWVIYSVVLITPWIQVCQDDLNDTPQPIFEVRFHLLWINLGNR